MRDYLKGYYLIEELVRPNGKTEYDVVAPDGDLVNIYHSKEHAEDCVWAFNKAREERLASGQGES